MVFVENITNQERSTHKVKFTTKIANLITEFSMRNATKFAGSKVILAFLESIGLIQGLQTLGLPKAASLYSPPIASFSISSSAGCSDANVSFILSHWSQMLLFVMRLTVAYPIIRY
jgi:hypothetical protein